MFIPHQNSKCRTQHLLIVMEEIVEVDVAFLQMGDMKQTQLCFIVYSFKVIHLVLKEEMMFTFGTNKLQTDVKLILL